MTPVEDAVAPAGDVSDVAGCPLLAGSARKIKLYFLKNEILQRTGPPAGSTRLVAHDAQSGMTSSPASQRIICFDSEGLFAGANQAAEFDSTRMTSLLVIEGAQLVPGVADGRRRLVRVPSARYDRPKSQMMKTCNSEHEQYDNNSNKEQTKNKLGTCTFIKQVRLI